MQGNHLELLVDYPFDNLPNWLEEADATIITASFWDKNCNDPTQLCGYLALVPDDLDELRTV